MTEGQIRVQTKEEIEEKERKKKEEEERKERERSSFTPNGCMMTVREYFAYLYTHYNVVDLILTDFDVLHEKMRTMSENASSSSTSSSTMTTTTEFCDSTEINLFAYRDHTSTRSRFLLLILQSSMIPLTEELLDRIWKILTLDAKTTGEKNKVLI